MSCGHGSLCGLRSVTVVPMWPLTTNQADLLSCLHCLVLKVRTQKQAWIKESHPSCYKPDVADENYRALKQEPIPEPTPWSEPPDHPLSSPSLRSGSERAALPWEAWTLPSQIRPLPIHLKCSFCCFLCCSSPQAPHPISTALGRPDPAIFVPWTLGRQWALFLWLCRGGQDVRAWRVYIGI